MVVQLQSELGSAFKLILLLHTFMAAFLRLLTQYKKPNKTNTKKSQQKKQNNPNPINQPTNQPTNITQKNPLESTRFLIK